MVNQNVQVNFTENRNGLSEESSTDLDGRSVLDDHGFVGTSADTPGDSCSRRRWRSSCGSRSRSRSASRRKRSRNGCRARRRRSFRPRSCAPKRRRKHSRPTNRCALIPAGTVAGGTGDKMWSRDLTGPTTWRRPEPVVYGAGRVVAVIWHSRPYTHRSTVVPPKRLITLPPRRRWTTVVAAGLGCWPPKPPGLEGSPIPGRRNDKTVYVTR
jgi:hypothetical protein